MDKLPYLFFAAWFLCVCSADTMLDDWRAAVVAVVGLIVIIRIAFAANPEVDDDAHN